MKHTICIPYSPCGGKFKNGKELRYSLRGFDKHFQGEYEVVLVGPKKPDWYQGTWLKQTQGKLKSALKLAADTYPDGFFWWYDDCVLIQDQTGEQLMATPARKSWGRIWTSWGKKLEEIRVRLEKEGYTPWDYSKPHGPYWFDKGMIDESFADWPGMAGKFPFESWILSKRDHPRRFGVEAQYYNEFRNNPSADKIFVNWCDRGFTPELIAWLDERFSIESPEEIGNVSPEENTTAGSEEISHTNSEEIGNMDNEEEGHNKTIHFIWIGQSRMPIECERIMQEWVELHPDFEFKLWDEAAVANCPYLSENVKDTSLTVIMRADLLRLEIMANEGGVYTDLDIRPYKNCWGIFQHVTDFCYSDEMAGSRSINAIFMAKRASRTAQAIRDHIGDISSRKDCDVIATTGPKAVQWALNTVCDYSSCTTLPSIGRQYGGILRLDTGVYLASSAKKTRKAFMSGALKHDYQYGIHLYSGTWYPEHKRKWKPRIMENEDIVTFDLSKYPHSGDKEWSMDDRHIYMLHQEAISEWEGSRVAVEIGSFKGRSTTALVEALNMGKLDHLHIIEIDIKKELLDVLKMAVDQTKITIHTTPACNTTITRADFVFIDGNHDWWAVSDTLRAVAWGAKVICMHDTSAFPRMKGCWGSHHAAQAMKIAKGRTWKEDCADRPTEDTWRGFAVSRAIED